MYDIIHTHNDTLKEHFLLGGNFQAAMECPN